MTDTQLPAAPAQQVDATRPLDLAGGLTLAEAKSIGTLFHQSGLFKDMRSAAQAITKILAGQELGIPPMQAMNGYHIVDGQPRLSAGLIGALVKRSGRYDYRVVEANDTLCRLAWTQDGKPVGESTFTRSEAETAGLIRASGGWAKYAEDMLFARALTRGARRYCPDVFHGAVYTLGEEADDTDERPEPVRAQLPSLRAPRPAPAPHALLSTASHPGGEHTLDTATVDADADAAEAAQQQLDELATPS